MLNCFDESFTGHIFQHPHPWEQQGSPGTAGGLFLTTEKYRCSVSTRTIGRRLLLGGALGALAAPRAQADTSFTNFRFPATGAPMARTMPDRLAEIMNVKDFGAVGDGSHDDTTNIQAA